MATRRILIRKSRLLHDLNITQTNNSFSLHDQESRLGLKLRCRWHLQITKFSQIFVDFCVCTVFTSRFHEFFFDVKKPLPVDRFVILLKENNLVLEFGFSKVVWAISVESYSWYLCHTELPLSSEQLQLVCLPCLGVWACWHVGHWAWSLLPRTIWCDDRTV